MARGPRNASCTAGAWIRRAGVVLAWLLALDPASAHETAGAGTPTPGAVRFESLTLSDGLADSTVFSVSQDHLGRIWFGTGAGGANVFDGYRVEHRLHDPDDPLSLSHSAAGAVLGLREGGVLVGTWGAGLNRALAVDGRFARLNPNSPPTHIQVLLEARSGAIWVGSADSGLFRLDRNGARPAPLLRPEGQPFGRIWSLAEGPTGTLWVAAADGLWRLEADAPAAMAPPAGGWNEHPRALVHTGDALWVADAEAVYRLEEGLPVEKRAGLELVNVLARDPRSGAILVGTLAGLCAVSADGAAVGPFRQQARALFRGRNIQDIFFDRGGVAWLATREAGVIKAHSTVPGFDGFRLPSMLETADAVFELAPDDVLVGSRTGLWRLRGPRAAARPYRVPGTQRFAVNRLAAQGGTILVGTRSGVYTFDPGTERLTPAPGFGMLREATITAIRPRVGGGVDIGTWARGLYRFEASGALRRFGTGGSRPLPDDSIADIEADGKGGLWVGLWNGGMVHIDDAGAVRAVTPEQLGIDGQTHDLLPLGDVLWVGTSFGLARYDPRTGRGERVTLLPEYPNTPVQRLAAGPTRLWAATTRGVVALERGNRAITRFGVSDGLVVEEFFARSGHRGAAGRVYFGGLGGVVSFVPGAVSLAVEPPAAAIVGARLDGVPVPARGRIEIPPEANALTLRHIAADFRNPSANRFRWRLAGLGTGWSAVSASPETLLTGLAPGDYVFELQAANSNGRWNRAAARLPVSVRPAWWQRRWGQGAVALGLLVAGYGWNYWYTLQVRRRNRELEAEVSRQTEALKAANRSLGEAASTDYLTRLLNRRGFLARVEAAAAREDQFFGLIDIDDFKSFNDRFGHPVGDRILQHVAAILEDAAGPGAVVARWGGEEFILRLRAASLPEAEAAAERLRREVERRSRQVAAGLPGVSITLGLAQRRAHETCMQVIDRADACLLQGKARGKNRLVSTA